MELMGNLFVQNPAGIFLVAGLFFGAYLLLRNANVAPRPQALLWPAVVWSLWALWEFLIVQFSPEANIRVDLILIIPLVLIISIAGIVLLFVKRKQSSPA